MFFRVLICSRFRTLNYASKVKHILVFIVKTLFKYTCTQDEYMARSNQQP